MTLIEPENRDHLEDTNPIQTIRDEPLPRWRKTIGWLSLLGALILTIGSTVLLLMPQPEASVVTPEIVAQSPTNLPPPTDAPQVDQQTTNADVPVSVAIPTLTADQIAAILGQSASASETDNGSFQVVRDNYNPFTIVPDRPRTEVIPYEIIEGDTVFAIAQRSLRTFACSRTVYVACFSLSGV